VAFVDGAEAAWHRTWPSGDQSAEWGRVTPEGERSTLRAEPDAIVLDAQARWPWVQSSDA
jgi:hypothetical protein